MVTSAARISRNVGRRRSVTTSTDRTESERLLAQLAGLEEGDPRRAAVTAVLNLGDARRGDPMCDLAAVQDDLAALGCAAAFMAGCGALSHWERERLGFYGLFHALRRYALALTLIPNELALRRMRLAETLRQQPAF